MPSDMYISFPSHLRHHGAVMTRSPEATLAVQDPASTAPALHKLLSESSILRDIADLEHQEDIYLNGVEEGCHHERLRGPLSIDPAESSGVLDESIIQSELDPSISQTARSRTELTIREWSSNNNLSQLPKHPFIVSLILDWSVTLAVGFLVVSYWRGTWTLLDIWTCRQPAAASAMNGESFCFSGAISSDDAPILQIRLQSAWKTYIAGNILLIPGVTLIALGWWQPSESLTQSSSSPVSTFPISTNRAFVRVFILYSLGAATVCIWRGIWYILDMFFFRSDQSLSRVVGAVGGAGLCFLLLAGNSLLAPPAMFLLDGPSLLPPPVAISIIMSYRSIALPAKDFQALPQDSYWVIAMDLICSYLVLPWGVVSFWRGMWYMMDVALWDFETLQSLHISISSSYAIGLACLVIASEDVVQYFPSTAEVGGGESCLSWSCFSNELFGRVRTVILAVGAVNFWRGGWLTWDEWLGQVSLWSAVLSHVIAVLGLTFAGCLSCITAPPSTIGADAVADPDCAEEPLFSNVPPPFALFKCFSIGRTPAPEVSSAIVGMSERAKTDVRRQTAAQSLDRTRHNIDNFPDLSLRHRVKRIESQFFRNR